MPSKSKPKPNKGQRRKRNPSSPGASLTPFSKKHLADSDLSDSELSEYFDAEPSDEMFSEKELSDLCAKLAPLLIKELTESLKGVIIDTVRAEFREELSTINDAVDKLKTENDTLKTELKNTQLELDELEQYGRRMCLDIAGVPGDTGTFDEPVERKVLDHAATVGIELSSADIDKCHRRGKRPDDSMSNRRVIVKFTNSKARDRVFAARKQMGDGVFVRESLTPHREYLSFRARQLKREGKIEKTWVAGARVFVQLLNDQGTKIIKHIDDITALFA